MNLFVRTLFVCLLSLIYAVVSQAEEVNIPAPNCALTALNDNQNLALQQLKGKVVYVDFWASWCGPCAKSFPFMNKLHGDLQAQGLEVIGVNLDENADDAKKFLENFPASFKVAGDPGEQCAKNFAVKAMPSSYLVDRNGIIRHVHLGFRPGEAEEFRGLVEKLLAENNQVKN